MVKSALNLLEAVDGVTTAPLGEKYSTLAWCLPLLFGLHDTTKCDEHDHMILVGIQKTLTKQLNECFHLDNLRTDSPLLLAAALDPWFQKLSFVSNAERSEVQKILVEKASISDWRSCFINARYATNEEEA